MNQKKFFYVTVLRTLGLLWVLSLSAQKLIAETTPLDENQNSSEQESHDFELETQKLLDSLLETPVPKPEQTEQIQQEVRSDLQGQQAQARYPERTKESLTQSREDKAEQYHFLQKQIKEFKEGKESWIQPHIVMPGALGAVGLWAGYRHFRGGVTYSDRQTALRDFKNGSEGLKNLRDHGGSSRKILEQRWQDDADTRAGKMSCQTKLGMIARLKRRMDAGLSKVGMGRKQPPAESLEVQPQAKDQEAPSDAQDGKALENAKEEIELYRKWQGQVSESRRASHFVDDSLKNHKMISSDDLLKQLEQGTMKPHEVQAELERVFREFDALVNSNLEQVRRNSLNVAQKMAENFSELKHSLSQFEGSWMNLKEPFGGKFGQIIKASPGILYRNTVTTKHLKKLIPLWRPRNVAFGIMAGWVAWTKMDLEGENEELQSLLDEFSVVFEERSEDEGHLSAMAMKATQTLVEMIWLDFSTHDDEFPFLPEQLPLGADPRMEPEQSALVFSEVLGEVQRLENSSDPTLSSMTANEGTFYVLLQRAWKKSTALSAENETEALAQVNDEFLKQKARQMARRYDTFLIDLKEMFLSYKNAKE